MNQAEQAILLKIQKLFALATSPNQAEAEAAAAKAMELLTRYNLTAGQVAEAQASYIRQNVPRAVEESPEISGVHSILLKYFFVKIVRATAKQEAPSLLDEEDSFGYAFLGRPHNVEVALYVRSFLLATFRRLWLEKFNASREFQSQDKPAFMLGLSQGLADKLAATRAKLEAEQATTAMTVSKRDAGLERFTQEHFPVLYSGRARDFSGSNSALAAGRAAGAKITINSAVRGPSVASGRFLTR